MIVAVILFLGALIGIFVGMTLFFYFYFGLNLFFSAIGAFLVIFMGLLANYLFQNYGPVSPFAYFIFLGWDKQTIKKYHEDLERSK